MYVEIASKYNGEPVDFIPCPKAIERDKYNALSDREKEKRIEAAKKSLSFEFKSISPLTFMEYSRNGNRSNFEAQNFSKRHALNALILGECVEHSGRFMDKIIEGIYSICEESAWQLPAHNSYERDKASFPLPDVTDPVVDLFAAETGALLAMAMYLLYDEFEEVSPFINKMIKSLLEQRIYKPYLNRHFWWMGNGDEPMCNWTVWCTQNVLLAIFLNPDSDMTLRKEAIKKASYSIDAFLKDYGEDGCCEEGAHYYRHSALCMFNATEVLNGVTDNFFKSVYSEKKVNNLATYIFNMNVADKYYFNYADCSALMDRAGAREYLFAKAIGNLEMMRFASKDFKATTDDPNEAELNLFFMAEELFSADEMLAMDTSGTLLHPDVYYDSVGVFISHGDKFSLSVKAGDNNDSHNHNDTGSIIVYKEGHPILIDVGVETYTKKTFSSERYDIWTMQSAYHNLPTINGIMQQAGEEFKATNVDYFLSDTISDIKMDIASAYPKRAGVASYLRHVSLYKSKQIVIEDEIKFADENALDNSYFLSFMTYEKPALIGNEIEIDNCKMQVIGDSLISVEAIPITDERLKWSWKHDIYRIIITPRVNKVMIVIS